MNEARLQRIVARIDRQLAALLGRGIDGARMLRDPLYARDVLLVCEAHPGTDLDSLARHFRIAAAEPVDDLGLPSDLPPQAASGFDASRPLDLELPLPPAPRRWLARVFGR